jgi:hypothetical protein
LAKSNKKTSTTGQRKSRPLKSSTLERESEQVTEDEIEGKEEFEKENP